MLRIINISKLQSAYRVRLAPNGSDLEWLSADEDHEVVLTGEPESSFLMRLEAFILSPLVPEELL
jgi:putative cardiolipin synthase